MKLRKTHLVSLWKPVALTACIVLAGDMPAGKDHRRYYFEKYLLNEFTKLPVVHESTGTFGSMPDRPDLAGIQEFFMTLDPELKRVPLERLPKAYDQRTSMKKSGMLIGGDWKEHPVTLGGRTRTLMFDPNDPTNHKVWVGAVTGGLWYNNDITSAFSPWVPVSDFWGNLVISSLASDPLNPAVFYAGTGEAQTAVTIYRESSGRGTGIWKTSDGGNSWQLLEATRDFAYVTDIIVRNENGSGVLYAGVASGFYKGENYESADGLYRSDDGGASWQQVLPLIPGTTRSYAVADIELGSSGRIFVGTMRSLLGLGAGVLLCSDDGFSWTLFEQMKTEIENQPDPTIQIPGRVIIASSPSHPSRVYAVFSSGGYNPAGFIFYRAYALVRSDDNGVTWTKTGMPNASGSWAYLAWHALSLEVDPGNPDVIYAGGLDQHKSTDGGATWKIISDWKGEPDISKYVHADQHLVVFRGNSPAEIVFATDGGLFYTTNGTSDPITFSERNNNFNTLQYYTCAIHPGAGEIFFLGGTQDNGTILNTGDYSGVWSMISGGDGAFCFIDNNQPEYSITSVYYNRYYIWKHLPDGQYRQVNYIGTNQGYTSSGIFINPADYDSRLNTLYANAMTFEGMLPDRILRIKNVTVSEGGEFICLNTGTKVPFSHVRLSPWSPAQNSVLFLGTQSGRIYRVDNAYTSPETNNIGSQDFPMANVSCIAVGDSNNELLVTFSNYGVPSVWYTSTGGSEWKMVEGNLPDMPVRWAEFHPDNPRIVLLATEIGLWQSGNIQDSQVTWTPVGGNFPNVRTDMLQVRKSDKTVLAATHGRGFFWKTFSPLGVEDPSGEESRDDLRIFPNPSHGNFFMSGNLPMEGLLKVYTHDGRLVCTQRFDHADGNTSVRIDIKGIAPGIYQLVVEGQEKSLAARIVIMGQ